MTTRRLRFTLWQHRRSLRRQALGQESAAAHLIRLGGHLGSRGSPRAGTASGRDCPALQGEGDLPERPGRRRPLAHGLVRQRRSLHLRGVDLIAASMSCL